jgi:hypothetical protein
MSSPPLFFFLLLLLLLLQLVAAGFVFGGILLLVLYISQAKKENRMDYFLLRQLQMRSDQFLHVRRKLGRVTTLLVGRRSD